MQRFEQQMAARVRSHSDDGVPLLFEKLTRENDAGMGGGEGVDGFGAAFSRPSIRPFVKNCRNSWQQSFAVFPHSIHIKIA